MYTIIRYHRDIGGQVIIRRGVTLEEAKEHCKDPETSSRTCEDPENVAYTEKYGQWFDGYTEE